MQNSSKQQAPQPRIKVHSLYLGLVFKERYNVFCIVQPFLFACFYFTLFGFCELFIERLYNLLIMFHIVMVQEYFTLHSSYK